MASDPGKPSPLSAEALEELRGVVGRMSPRPWGFDPLDDDIVSAEGAVVGYIYEDHDGTSADRDGVLALRNSADALLAAASRVVELEKEAVATDICAHCKEPFERGDAMSRHAQECPRNPVVMLNTAQVERISALEAALGQACELIDKGYAYCSDCECGSTVDEWRHLLPAVPSNEER